MHMRFNWLRKVEYEIYSQDEFVTYHPMNITSPLNGIGLYVNVKYDTDLMNLF